MVSWYFPVGLNLVSFILLPLRYWPAVFLGQAIGQIAFSHLYYDFALTELWSTLYKDWIDKILLLLPLIYIKYQRIPLEIDRFKGLMLILGGFVGILFALMIMYSGIWLWKNYNNIELTKLLHFIVSLLVLILSTSSIYLFQPEVIDLLRMVGVLTFIWFAYQFGWIGVIVAALSLNSLILIIAYGVSDTAMMLENQTTLTTYGLTALLLGALVNEYNLIRLRLVDNNLLLIQKNKSLVSLNKNIQQLSEKIIDVQEAVTNSIKYSQAENFSIDLTVEEKGIRLFRKYKNKD